ncbi:MAG: Hsp70 family protein, partial [Verrucomicrobiota bacterium]
GILHVTATDKGTNKEQKISITGSSGLDKDEVEKLRQEAEAHAAEDAKKRDSAEARNQLDGLVFQTEKQLSEAGDQLPAEAKAPVEALLADAKKVLENQAATVDELKEAATKLQEELGKIAQAAAGAAGMDPAAAAAAAGAAGAGAPPPPADEPKKDDPNVVDADFEVVDDEKK